MNEAVDVYRELYYEGGVSSVYFWNLDDGFAGVVLLKKGMVFIFPSGYTWMAEVKADVCGVAGTVVSPSGKGEGVWDSIHVFEAIDRARTAHYQLTSTVILHLSMGNEGLGEMDLSGNMTRQVEQDLPVENDASHIANVGKMVEEMEFKLRNLLR